MGLLDVNALLQFSGGRRGARPAGDVAGEASPWEVPELMGVR